jgi:4-amino-4-deoxy-L-arabinose transferase-like glycosyltransferase
MTKLQDTSPSSTRRLERVVAILAIAVIAMVPIAIVLSLRASLDTTTTSGIVLALLAASGLLTIKRASWHARSEPQGDARAA